MLPIVISNLIQAKISFERITDFLLKEEIDKNEITYKEMKGTYNEL